LTGYAKIMEQVRTKTFERDLNFLKKYTDVVALSDASGDAQVAVASAYQGRVMTSTAEGPSGLSFGWINNELIASGRTLAHINVYGGEDRFWMGPEGGQFAIFFEKDAPFDLEHWQTPAVIDTEPFDLLSTDRTSVALRRQAELTNYSGAKFNVRIDRTVRLLSSEQAGRALGLDLPEAVKTVAYESDNKITNTGPDQWTRQTGLLSIWILGMFNPSPRTTIIIPFNPGPEDELGPKVNDAYFGKVPAQRLLVKDNMLFFSGDGRYRSKIGLSPKRAKPVLGSYDAANKVLTVVQYTRPENANNYVNSMWQLQAEPYAGDVVNSYNDARRSPA